MEYVSFTWVDGVVERDYSFYDFLDISADGTHILGHLMGANNTRGGPALKTNTGSTVIRLLDDWEVLTLMTISRDGSKVIGEATSDTETGSPGFLWNLDGEVILFDGLDGGFSYSSCVANTGLVVGQTGRGGAMPANYWAPESGYELRLLADLLGAHGLELDPAWILSAPVGLTPDGRIMVGTGTNGGYRLTFR